MNSQDGISCNRIYSSDIAVVECTGINIDDVPQGPVTSMDCFHSENTTAEFHALKGRSAAMNNPFYTILTLSEHVNAMAGSEAPKIRGRQTSGFFPGQDGWCGPNPGPSLVGDGNPHENYFHKQLLVSSRSQIIPISPHPAPMFSVKKLP
jgi:hypothetical protein